MYENISRICKINRQSSFLVCSLETIHWTRSTVSQTPTVHYRWLC